MREQLTAILVERFQVPTESITSDATLEDMGVDSLDTVELCLILEKDLGITLADDDLIGAERFDAMVELLGERLRGSRAAVTS